MTVLSISITFCVVKARAWLGFLENIHTAAVRLNRFLDNTRIDAANIAVVSGTGDSAMSALLLVKLQNWLCMLLYTYTFFT